MLNIIRALRGASRRTPALPTLPLELAAGERPLAWAADDTDTWYVGTKAALHLCAAAACLRLPWESIERAEWDGDEERLEVVELADFGQPRPVHRARLQEPERLLQLVRERITASVVVSRFVPVAGKRGLTVVARRAPHSSDPLTWAFVVDRGLDESAPEVTAAAELGLAEAKAEVGE
ncbi:MAG: hypothetical protein ACRELV_14565 [Longimicrobiales bacterium]